MILFLIALFPLVILWRAYVLLLLWNWLIEPEFLVSELTMPTSIGIILLVFLFTHKDEMSTSNDELWVNMIVVPTVALFMGYITSLFL